MLDQVLPLQGAAATPALPIFAGRQRELDLIYGLMAGPQRGHVAVSGPLGIGKSSLLRQVADPRMVASRGLDPGRHLFVELDLQSVTPFSGARFWRRVAQLARLRSPRPQLAAALDRLLTRPEMDIIDVEILLDAAAAEGQVLVLLMDELEWALQVDDPGAAASRDFLAQTASLARRSPRAMSLVTASDKPLHEATRAVEGWRGSPFATVFTALPLGPLDATASSEFLDLALAQAGLPSRSLLRDPILELAAGQPAALEAAAFSLQRQRRSEGSVMAISQAALAAVREPARGDARPSAAPAPVTPQPLPPRGLWMDPTGGEVLFSGRRIDSLTSLEYSLLRLLYGQPGRLCSKEAIVRHVWGAEHRQDGAVEAVEEARVEKLVSRLRHKIEPVPGRPQILRTVRGRGYRYVPLN